MGGLRSVAQAVSYEIPLLFSIITICLLAGTLDVVTIANQQSGGFLSWNIFGGGALAGLNQAIASLFSPVSKSFAEIMQIYYPLGLLSFVGVVVLCLSTVILFGIYLTSACAEVNRIPFDLPEAESELVSGYNTEYSGIKFAIFFLAEFTNLFVVCTIATVMFLGGGDCPFPSWLNPLSYPAIYQPLTKLLSPILSFLINDIHLVNPPTFWAAIWVIIKTYSLVFLAILVRGTLPRFRIDQLMDFGWKRLIPITLIIFILVSFARGVINFHV
jgi:NADH:ubiquinone oxidoreductase subunit H